MTVVAVMSDAAHGYFLFTLDDPVSSTVTFERSATGGMIRNLPVFRAGTFRDSRGRKHTYTVKDLNEVVANFHALKPIFPNPPFRSDHSRSIEKVKGYFVGARVDGDFIRADVQLTEPDAVDKWERTTYRSWSSEIGPYRTNDDEVFNQTLLGAAFVDIPAVERLFSKADPEDGDARYFMEESSDMSAGKAPAAGPPATENKIEGEGADFAAAVAAATAAAITANKGDDKKVEDPEPAMFSFMGKEYDADGLQEALKAIETAQAEQVGVARAEYAKGLVEGKRFTAPQLDALEGFFKGLDDDQFTAARAVFDAMPEASLLANHGDGVTNSDGTAEGELSAFAKEMSTLEDIVKNHRRSGVMSDEQIQKTASFQRLQELKTQASK